MITARMLWYRMTADLLKGRGWHSRDRPARAPRQLLWDNEAGIGRRGHFAECVARFRETRVNRLAQAKPLDPETKRIVEGASGYLEIVTMPARPSPHQPTSTRSSLTGCPQQIIGGFGRCAQEAGSVGAGKTCRSD